MTKMITAHGDQGPARTSTPVFLLQAVVVVAVTIALGLVAGRWGGFVWMLGMFGFACVADLAGKARLSGTAMLGCVLLLVPAIIWFVALPDYSGGAAASTTPELSPEEQHDQDVAGCQSVVRSAVAYNFLSGSTNTEAMLTGELAAYREALAVIPRISPAKVTELLPRFDSEFWRLCDKHM